MSHASSIPTFGLYGESDQFPDVVHCEKFSERAPINNWRIVPHRHPHMSQVFVISRGGVKVHVDGRTLDLSDGAFLFVPAHCVHELNFRPETEGAVISIPLGIQSSIGPNGHEVLDCLAEPIAGTQNALIYELTQLLRDASEPRGAFRAQLSAALTHALLAALAEFANAGRGKHATKSDRLVELDKLIAERAADGWSATQYARALAISTGHLSRLCRAASGVGAAAYIERRRLSEACRLLAFTQLRVSAVGYRLGYADPAYFSRRFRRVHGKSPSVYRAACQG